MNCFVRKIVCLLVVLSAGLALGEEVVSHSVAMASIHNGHRVRAGLAVQEVDANLTAVAQNWANTMASRCSMFHGGGEQVIAYSGTQSYEEGFRLWLNSGPHRSWLFSGNPKCGFGYAVGRNGCAYFAGAFGGGGTVSTSYSYSSSGYSSGRRWRLFGRWR